MIKEIIQKLDHSLEQGTRLLLIACLFLMLGLSVTGIVLRWFQISFSWIDPFVRHLVFLSAFLGGALAAGSGKHIAIDIFSKILESWDNPRLLKGFKVFISIVSALACLWMVVASIEFTKSELEFGKESFFGIHSGFLVSIIPFGMTLIFLRFVLRVFLIPGKAEE